MMLLRVSCHELGLSILHRHRKLALTASMTALLQGGLFQAQRVGYGLKRDFSIISVVSNIRKEAHEKCKVYSPGS